MALHAESQTLTRIRQLQAITIVWMCVEAGLSLWSAWKADSPSLLGFGGDSVIELLSATVVLWRFRHPVSEKAEKRAALIAGSLLIVLALAVLFVSIRSLAGYREPTPSPQGIAVLIAAALIMPYLARQKHRLSDLTGSAALRADAVESMICFYLSLIALSGLAVQKLWNLEWADPAAALLLIPLIVREAIEALRGRPCC
jgi:Co/Zn/Cd efflux system component